MAARALLLHLLQAAGACTRKRAALHCLLLIALLSPILLINISNAAALAAQNYYGDEPGVREFAESHYLTAIVVIESASGSSYIKDRNKVASMAEIADREAAQEFVARYEPLPQNIDAVREQFQRSGFTIVAQDNLFLVVSGSPLLFSETFGISMPTLLNNLRSSRPVVIRPMETASRRPDWQRIDGIIVMRGRRTRPVPALNSAEQPRVPADAFASLSQVDPLQVQQQLRRALLLDPAHRLGYTGVGVNVAFVDIGFSPVHRFFEQQPANISFYLRDNRGAIRPGTHNYTGDAKAHHGMSVATYLALVAPDAHLISYASDSTRDVHAFLAHMRQQQAVDVLSLSIGFGEGCQDPVNIADVRMQVINLTATGTVVVVAGGNGGACSHNAFAAIPEVVAVGGATLAAADGNDAPAVTASRRAASFLSSIMPGRRVPDVVAVSEDLAVLRGDNYLTLTSGTSYAAPQVAGIVALLKQRFPGISQAEAKQLLQESAVDILAGVSADGDEAEEGYDRATGHGLVQALPALYRWVTLEAGWNFVGFPTSYPHTAAGLLGELAGSCSQVGQWTDDGWMTVTVQPDGQLSGTNFLLRPLTGYHVHCSTTVTWRPQPDPIPVAPPALSLRAGWNAIAAPARPASCTAAHLLAETGGECVLVNTADAGSIEPVSAGTAALLQPGQGYWLYCKTDVEWVPSCAPAESTRMAADTLPRNRLTADPVDNRQLQVLIHTARTPATASVAEAECRVGAVEETYLDDTGLTVTWQTSAPCLGSLVLLDDAGKPFFRAFDDRGLRHAATSHQVTLRGLSPGTLYRYGILSGRLWQTDADAGAPYQVTTQPARPAMRVVPAAAAHQAGWQPFMLAEALLATGEELPLPLFGIEPAVEDGGATAAILVVPSLTTVGGPGQPQLRGFGSGTRFPAPAGSDQSAFRFAAFDNSGSQLTYRLEISEDNFSTVAYTFDQRFDATGWSAPSYLSGMTATFTLSELLNPLSTYQWRVYAHNGRAWSSSSEIASFTPPDAFKAGSPARTALALPLR